MRNLLARTMGFVVLIALAASVAWAGAALPRRSVDTEQLKRGAVTSPKIANRTIRKKDLAPGAANPAFIRRFGPLHMARGDEPRTARRVGPLEFVAHCGVSNADTDAELALETHVEHVSYRSGSGDFDEDLNPGEGAGWAQFDAFADTDPIEPPYTVDSTAYLPDGRAVFGKTVLVTNAKAGKDCTLFGWFEIID